MTTILFAPQCRRQGIRTRPLVLLALLLSLFGTAAAHEIRPAVVELRFTEDGAARFAIATNLEALIAGIGPQHTDTANSPNAQEYNRLRRLSPQRLRALFDGFRDEFLAGITVRDAAGNPLPARVSAVDIPAVGDTELARTSTITLVVSPGSGTGHLTWSWQPSFGPSIIRVAQPGGDYGYTAYLEGGQASEPIPIGGDVQQGLARIIGDYLWIGFTHILPKGLDHILFVVGLFLLSPRLRPLLVQITSFTVAHTVTLALGVTGVVSLSPAIVEPLIAASIVYVAVENIASSRLRAWRPVLVFAFGLLHGLGFAGVLREVGISQAYFVTALLSFNVGVELGQIAVVLGCFLAVGLWFRHRSWYRGAISVPASAVVAAVGAFWFVERTVMA